MTDSAIAAEIGRRLEQLRLERNITQQALADEVGITPKTYRQLIQGGGKFETLIGILRALGELERLDQFIPETPFSPIEQLRLQGRRRQRASGAHANDTANDTMSDSVREPAAGESGDDGMDW
ncbi:helix-turn-helix domain-containing protein [Alcanivorax sp. JB21]|uniref:helix-turn-helix domain-containing protein n=1 Tax=Alcanivorax limicola TaxID=2874102 RepID=UPI001CC04F72|nr:helix-turn-helix transcriptional regulator [Alcanivorax limicola]MBZ2187579.1 helix-turn-helix domain-containing protein [Alcanivorax limicola]